jgi:TonB-dependent receptor
MKSIPGLLLHAGRTVVVASAIAGAASAQTASGLIEGLVIDSTAGQNLQGAIVRVVGNDTLRAETARDGSFTLRNLPDGSYQLEVSYFGYPTRTVSANIAGGSTRIDIDLGQSFDEDVVVLDPLNVEGEALGQARATNQQRVATSMVNITSEEMLGQMTDNNIATALQRLPGLSANADTFSEIPRFVNIRGFNADLNSVQLNGARLPTSGTGRGSTPGAGDTARAFALDDIPGNAVTAVEVVKAPTPDMDGDAVGGIVNMITKSAFDRTGRSIEFQAGMDYVELRDSFVPNFSIGFSDLFLDRKLGLRLDFNYSKGDEGFDNIDYDSRPLPAGLPANAGYGLPADGKLVQLHEDTEYNNYFIERDRYGFSLSFDYKLSDTTTVHFKPVYTQEERAEDDRRFHKIMDNRHSRDLSTADRTNAGAAFTGAAIYDGTNLGAATFTVPGIGSAVRTGANSAQYRTLTSVSETAATTSTLPNGNGRGRAGYFQSLNDRDIQFYSLDLGGETDLGSGVLTYGYFNSQNQKVEDTRQARFYRNGMQWSYNRSSIVTPQYNPVAGSPDPYARPANQLTGVDRFTNPNSSTSENTGNGVLTAIQREIEENVNQVHLDLETPFPESTGITGKFKTGLKLRAMERSYDQNQQFYNFANTAAYNAFPFADFLRDNPNRVGPFAMPYYPDAASLLAAARAGQLGLQRHIGNSQRASSLNADYDASEDTLAGYLMGTFDIGPKLQLTTGVRVEHNWFEASVPLLDSAAYPLQNRAPNFVTNENDYTLVLPGVHLRYEARRDILFRTAYTETYGRPSFTESIGTAVLDESTNTLTVGNPGLEPFRAKNYDISVEYFGASTYLQLALFHKRVSDAVVGTTVTVDGPTTINGVPLADASTYTVNTFGNEDTQVNQGIEFAGRYKFIHAPGFLDGFYLDGSVTYTDSRAKYGDRPGETLPTYGASEWLYNFGLGYDKDRFAAQISYRYRSPYLEGLDNIDQQNQNSGSGPDARDDWWGEQKYWNWESSYRISKNFRVYLNVSNLLEFTNVGYQSPPENNYPEDSYFHQRRWSFGVKGTF